MAQSNNILQELQELNSRLAELGNENCYTVPSGYFDGLTETILQRIKAMNANNAVEELNILSPSLNSISKEVPYKVPAGYFDGLAERAMRSIHESNQYETADEEIETLSPLLSSLKKQNPYTVPQGYFENISLTPVKKEAKVISFTKQSWFRYAVAAAVIGIITLTGILLFGKKNEERRLARFENRLNREIKTMSDDDLKDFVQYTDAGLTGEEKVSNNNNNTDEIKELLKDIPESELKEFIEETADTETETTLMN